MKTYERCLLCPSDWQKLTNQAVPCAISRACTHWQKAKLLLSLLKTGHSNCKVCNNKIPENNPNTRVCVCVLFTQLCPAPCNPINCSPAGFSLSMRFPRKEYWSGEPFPSPGIFLSQGLNPGLLHCRQILYLLSHQESPNTPVATWK